MMHEVSVVILIKNLSSGLQIKFAKLSNVT